MIKTGDGNGLGTRLQWNPSNADTIGATAACPEYIEAFVFWRLPMYFQYVWLCMLIHAVEHYKGAFQTSPLPYTNEKG